MPRAVNPHEEDGMRPIQTILVPVDFSEHSRRALDYATGFAQRFGAAVHVVHVMHMPSDVRVTGTWWSTLRGQALEALRELLEGTDSAGLKIESHIAEGHPSESIVELATNLGADLIVMGSHGRTGLAHVLLGSVAERTIRSAPCPVITLKKS
jgi:nucleotide-binding universal stress UspA family protein